MTLISTRLDCKVTAISGRNLNNGKAMHKVTNEIDGNSTMIYGITDQNCNVHVHSPAKL